MVYMFRYASLGGYTLGCVASLGGYTLGCVASLRVYPRVGYTS